MRHLLTISILWLCIGSNAAYTQSASINKFSLSAQFGMGYISPRRFWVPTTFDIEQNPSIITPSSDFPRLELAPLERIGLKLEYRLSKKWSSSLGIGIRHYQLRGRVGAALSSLEAHIRESWFSYDLPIDLNYRFPFGHSAYRFKLNFGIVPTYYAINGGTLLTFYDQRALGYSFERFRAVNLGYSLGVEWEFPWNRRWLTVGLQAYMAWHSLIELKISLYESEIPLGPDDLFWWRPKESEIILQYRQKTFPHQILFFISIPLTNSRKAK